MIFLGAGASAPFGIPTAKTLTTDIRTLLSKEHQRLLKDIDSFWRGTHKRDPNYEDILTFLTGLTNPGIIPIDSIIHAFIRDHNEHVGDYKKIVDAMYLKIIDYCTAPFVTGEKYLDPEKLEGIFERTYDIFALCRNELIFTTNYDPSVELWCQKRNIQLFDNTTPTGNPEVRVVIPTDEGSVAQGKSNIDPPRGESSSLKIVRLHGSVWIYETKDKKKIKMNRPRDKLLFTDSYPHLEGRPHMIFPGQESILARGEWDTSYQYFRKSLQGHCLVIGYSFQDVLINGVFIDNLEKEELKTIGILSPHPSEVLKNLFRGREVPSHKIVEIPAEFGTDHALRHFVTKWVNGVLGIRLSSGHDPYLNQFRQKMKRYLD